jgi:hypothetical protein
MPVADEGQLDKGGKRCAPGRQFLLRPREPLPYHRPLPGGAARPPEPARTAVHRRSRRLGSCYLGSCYLGSCCQLALVAELDGSLAGFALAESSPQVLRVHTLEGPADACRLLLDRLVRAAGERDVSCWYRVSCTAQHRLLEGRGFARLTEGGRGGKPSHLYFYWARNQDV